jgi:hypothetical protein
MAALPQRRGKKGSTVRYHQNLSPNDILPKSTDAAPGRMNPGCRGASVTTAGSFRSHVGIRGNTDRLWAGVYLTGPTLGAVHIGSSTPTVNGTTEQYGSFGRLTYQLLQGEDYSLHVGGDAQAVFKSPTNTTTGIASLTLSDRLELRIDPTAILTTGAMANAFAAQVYSGEAAAGGGPLFFQGEYLHFNIDRALGLPTLQFNGWNAQASWTLTGESRVYNPSTGSYGTIIPTHPFAATGYYWGAWEIAGRYSGPELVCQSKRSVHVRLPAWHDRQTGERRGRNQYRRQIRCHGDAGAGKFLAAAGGLHTAAGPPFERHKPLHGSRAGPALATSDADRERPPVAGAPATLQTGSTGNTCSRMMPPTWAAPVRVVGRSDHRGSHAQPRRSPVDRPPCGRAG